jgi:Tol biopolymer transport system component
MKMLTRIGLTLLILLIAVVMLILFFFFPKEKVATGSDFPILKGPYLGQDPPGLSPELFAPGIVSANSHSATVFSPDGDEIYWRPLEMEAVDEILFMRLENGQWTPPQVVPFASRFFDSDDPCFSTDGDKLFFTSWRPLRWYNLLGQQKERIWYVERTAGGWSQPQPVGPAVNAMELHWQVSVSTDGTLCFTSEGDIHCAALEGEEYGQPERLGGTINTASREGTPFIAPDERYMIFSSNGHPDRVGDYDLYISVRRPDGSWSQAANLGWGINSPHQELYPVVSPDSKYLFFLSDRNGAHSVYWVDFGTVEPLISAVPPTNTPLPTEAPMPSATATPEPTPTGEPTPLPFSASGEIAFTSAGRGNNDVYIMDIGGSNLRQLTSDSSDDYWATWSPDGTQLAFASDRRGNYDLYVLDVPANLDAQNDEQTLNLRQLTGNRADDLEPAWSPDGQHLAFMSNRGGNVDIYVLSVDGGEAQQLTDEEADDWLPAWSPDGSQIVFVSNRDGDEEIYLMDAQGGNQQALTDNDADDSYPAWSPDGSQISFACGAGRHRELCVMDVDSGNLRQLTEDGASVWVSAWSPDGEWIVFTSNRDGNRELYLVDVEGQDLHRLTENGYADGIAAWRPVNGAAPAEASLGDTWTRAADGMEMVYVPSDSFEMGSTVDQIDEAMSLCDQYPDAYGKCVRRRFEVELPQHSVALDGFWLDRTEVTNAQYALCVEAGQCQPSRLANDEAYNQDDSPVAGIPWADAADYCTWAAGRLPTEAEWEYAARGPEGSIFPWGEAFDCTGGNLDEKITGCDEGYDGPSPVGSFPDGASWCGALDLAGNVWEWVADFYGPYPAEQQENPTGPATGTERLLRGGSWGYLPAFVRTAYRYPVPPDADYLAVGFRCALSFEGAVAVEP